jgi:replication-associated recombination protein RarA
MKTSIKYTPASLNDVIFPSAAVERRIRAYAAGQMAGHIMLHGPNGTGKTTVAHLLVQAIGGADAQCETDFEKMLAKPDDLKDCLRQSCALARLTTSGKHFMVFHEFDSVKRGVSKFWTALDDCEDDAMAIITTNNPMSIDRSVRSRFDMIHFPGITAQSALPRIQVVLTAEGLTLPDAQVLCYLRLVEHFMDLRKYFKQADELLFLHRTNQPLPAWKVAPPKLKVV